MKKIVLIAVFVLCGALIQVCADEVKVTMKNGTVFTGELKEFVPTDHVTVIVAGIESTIPISEVASIERPEAIQATTAHKENGDDSKLQYGKYDITDTKEYPESFTLKIGDQELTMVLVRGGWFNMGYNGHNSMLWDTEPVHKVSLSSFYVSKELLNYSAAQELLKRKKIKESNNPFPFDYRTDADQAVRELNRITDASYRLLTEAEWEYISIMSFAERVFGIRDFKDEWVSDNWSKYGAAYQINPKRTLESDNYIIRHFSRNNDKWKRKKVSLSYRGYIRIAISADAIKLK